MRRNSTIGYISLRHNLISNIFTRSPLREGFDCWIQHGKESSHNKTYIFGFVYIQQLMSFLKLLSSKARI